MINTGDDVTQAFSVDAIDNALDDDSLIEVILDRLLSLRVRIVYLCTQPRLQQRFFATMFRTNKFYGAGYGIILGWVSEDAPRDGSGEVSPDAVRGSEGATG